MPFGVFSTAEAGTRAGIAIEDAIVDLAVLEEKGIVEGPFASSSLNEFLERGPQAWHEVREALQEVLRERTIPREAIVASADVRLHVPVDIGDYVDFYSSIEHATNVGKIFRPQGEALTPNYRWMPIGYHGRTANVSVQADVRRPQGQVKEHNDPTPRFTASQQLDFELELGFIVGTGNDGKPVSPKDAGKHLFGAVLLCDWSARDIQSWEGQPLGPFLSKSFATTISPWIVTLEALEPFRVPNRPQDPEPLPYLRVDEPWAFDIDLEVAIQTPAMRKSWDEPEVITRVNFRHMYWNVAQQLAHLTSNGGVIRPGDLLGSGTVSGTARGMYGSLLEATLRGTEPIALPHQETRTFLEDGDTIVMRGSCRRHGLEPVGFGELRATVVSAMS